MAMKYRDQVFGVQERALLTLLKNTTPYVMERIAGEPDVLLVRTPFLVLQTWRSEAVLSKYPLRSEDEYAVKGTHRFWAELEGREGRRLRLTNDLRETDPGLARRLVLAEDTGLEAWVSKAFLDVYGADASTLAAFQFESVPSDGCKVAIGECPVRIMRQAGCTCGYIMPVTMRGVKFY